MPKRAPRFWKIPFYRYGHPVIVYKRPDGGETWLSFPRFKLVKKGGKF